MAESDRKGNPEMARRIRKAREDLGLSLPEFGSLIDKSAQSVWRWESWRNLLEREEYARIARIVRTLAPIEDVPASEFDRPPRPANTTTRPGTHQKRRSHMDIDGTSAQRYTKDELRAFAIGLATGLGLYITEPPTLGDVRRQVDSALPQPAEERAEDQPPGSQVG